jgi:hypothetical protein
MRETLKTISISLIVVALALTMFGLIVFGNRLAETGNRVYNCEMLIGGWHPDFPRQVINECRKPQNEKDLLRKSGPQV